MINNSIKQHILNEYEGVVAVGEGVKIKDGAHTDDYGYMVFVERKKDKSELKRSEMIPPKIRGEKTDIIETGGIPESMQLPRREKHRPAPGGASAMWYGSSACTLGAIVYKGKEKFILQNTHCANPHWLGADIGDEIMQPSPADGGKITTDVIGESAASARISFEHTNTIDATLVKVYNQEDVIDEIIDIGKLDPTLEEAVPGMILKKSGRTSGITHLPVIAVGVVASVNFRMPDGSLRLTRWVDQIFVDNGVSNTFDNIKGGDSSSLAVSENNRPVGLVFAASPRIGILNKIQNVTDAFGVKFAPFEPVLELVKDTNRPELPMVYARFPNGDLYHIESSDMLVRGINVLWGDWTDIKPVEINYDKVTGTFSSKGPQAQNTWDQDTVGEKQ